MLGISSAFSGSSAMRIIMPPLSMYCAILAVGRECGLSSVLGRGDLYWVLKCLVLGAVMFSLKSIAVVFDRFVDVSKPWLHY